MNYNEAINSSEVVLVEFFATMMPVVEQLKELLDGSVPVFQLDIDRNDSAASEAGVESVPTFIIYKAGREMWRGSGEMDGEVLLAKVESFR